MIGATFQPLVSIVIPVFNGANYLARAIESALAQTYPHKEILVINDGSTDAGETRRVAMAYEGSIRYYEKENGGVSSALNLGIHEMQGEYFSWLSHDDEYHINKVQRQIEFLQPLDDREHIIFTDFELIDEESKGIGYVQCGSKKVTGLEAVAFGLINGCTMFIPKRCFDEVGLFDTDLPTTQDYDMWFRLMMNYQIIHMPEILVKIRHHQQQQSRTDQSHKAEGSDFYISFIKAIMADDRYRGFVSRSFFCKLAAFLSKMNYSHAVDYIKTQNLRTIWFADLRIAYYSYVDTSWGNRVGLSTLVSDPRRFMSKLGARRI